MLTQVKPMNAYTQVTSVSDSALVFVHDSVIGDVVLTKINFLAPYAAQVLSLTNRVAALENTANKLEVFVANYMGPVPWNWFYP